MSVQSVTTQNIRRTLPGTLEDIQPMEKASFIAEDATIDFGKPVVRGTNAERQAKLPSGAGQDFLGITIRDLSRENANVGSNFSQYKLAETMSVLRQGAINVIAGVDVSPAEPVYYYHTANAGKVPGDLVNADDAGFTTLIANTTWERGALENELSIIRII